MPKQQDDRLHIGASWYPEMWSDDDWPHDVARMRELGFNVVRLFEFAWHRFEPGEGEFDFNWARRVMDLCRESSIDVIVGTPTAAPPAWLTAKYPQVLQTHADGSVATHGKRKHFSHIAEEYRRHCRRIVGAMAEAFADHPALLAWQIDNEMGGRDYGDEARRKFHAWLEQRYGSIDELNRAWGLEFWSQAYDSFAQAPMPVASVGSIEVPERHHPSLIMAVARFQSEHWTEYITAQCDAIRAHSDKPITTNMCGTSLGSDWYEHNQTLDLVGYSLYKDVDHYAWNLMFLDRMRAEKRANGAYRPYWLLETAPNWSGGGKQWNIHHDENGVQAMAWLSTLLGGSMVLFWQWRSHWAGQEMQHGTCVTATGQWAPNKDAWTTLAARFAEHGAWLLEHPPAPADVAVVQHCEAAWAFSIDPIDDNMRYDQRWRDDYHLPLCRNHIWRDVIDPRADFSPYKLIVMPLCPMIDDDVRRRLSAWVEAGGRLLLGPLVGYRTTEFTAFTDQTFGGLESLIGADSALRFTVHWVEDRVSVVFDDASETRTRNWCEGFAATTGRVIAHYRRGYGDGHGAVVDHRVGDGRVMTLGCQVDETTYLRLMRMLMDDAGVKPVATGSGDAAVVPRAGADGEIAGWGVVNLAEQPRTIELPGAGVDLLTGNDAGPGLELAPLQAMLVRR